LCGRQGIGRDRDRDMQIARDREREGRRRDLRDEEREREGERVWRDETRGYRRGGDFWMVERGWRNEVRRLRRERKRELGGTSWGTGEGSTALFI